MTRALVAARLEPARAAFAAVLRRGLVAWLLALPLALVAARAGSTAAAGASAGGLAVLWLHLPGVLLALAAIVATVDAWPLFGRDREGGALVRRLRRTSLDGCGMAAAGGTVAAAVLLTAAGASFAVACRAFLDLEAPHTFVRVAAAPPSPALDARRDRMVLRGDGTVADAVRLNPLVAWAPGTLFVPVELDVTVDGVRVGRGCRVSGNGEQIVLPLPTPRAVHTLELARVGAATLTLLFPAGSVELRAEAPRSLAMNMALAAACYASPALLALLAAATLRRVLGSPALLTFAVATFAILALVELGPESPALTAGARGRWILGEPLAWRPTVLAALALTAAAAVGPKLAVVGPFRKRRTTRT
ncbi:MAG: hypothetical protein R3F56_05255 [Planctomycetota bacterium]